MATLILGAVLANNLLLDGLDGVLLSLLTVEDTQYAPGYSDRGFRGVQVGMSMDDVRRLLGEPLDKGELDDRQESWRHARSPSDSSYRVRALLFRNGRVATKFHEFYVD